MRCSDGSADVCSSDLFGPGMIDVAATQPRLDMADRNLAEIGGKRRRHRRQRVAVNEYPVGPLGIETFTEPGDKAREQRVERLVGLHDVKVDVGDDARDLQHPVENLALLPIGTASGRERVCQSVYIWVVA